MGKRKKEKDFKFNPADYNYMDNMPLEGWIWEFIRRSEDYNSYYRQWSSIIEKLDMNDESRSDFTEKYLSQYSPFHLYKPDLKWTETIPFISNDPKRRKLAPVLTENLQIGRGIDFDHGEYIEAPHPRINRKKIGSITTYSVSDYSPVYEGSVGTTNGEVKQCFAYPLIQHPVDLLYQYQNQDNIVMALIDISAPESVDDLLHKLKEQLMFWREKTKLPLKRAPKTAKSKLTRNSKIWKSYLIVYDLVASGNSYKEVSDILCKHDETYSDEKKIERHYKNAFKLINGGYKKYL